MSDSGSKPQPAPKRGLPLWAKALAAMSVLLMVAGIAIPLMGGGRAAAPSPSSGPTGVTGLTTGGMENVGDSGPTSDPGPTGAAAWGPSVFRMGFSFFVGFAIAFALRSFLKLAIAALGFFFLALFGLQYAGLVDVKWAAMSERYDTLSQSLETQAQGAWSSMSVLLPSAAAASAGLFAGFWRRA
jgi:uncharacterized membrane protein (Fun14 family)